MGVESHAMRTVIGRHGGGSMLDLSGKVAVVTGAGSGIGRGISLAMASAGADILCADVAGDRAEKTAGEVRALGRNAIPFVADVRDRAALEAMAVAAVTQLGGLNIAVANAGIGRGGSILHMSEDEFDTQIDVNLKGVFLTVQTCAREMVKQNTGGRIITIASLAAERPSPFMFAYCASKAGVRMMSRCWALDLAPFGITVNSIGPGIIDTPLGAPLIGEGDDRALTERRIPAGRVGYPDDIGRLACWLASDEAEYITGTYNLVDGGLADASGFGAGPMGDLARGLREARKSMPGDQLLAMMDATATTAATEGRKSRADRGVF